MNNSGLLQDGVFKRLRRTQANNGLRLDLNRLAGLWVAAHARLAVRFHNTADPGDHEFARPALGFLHGELEELIKEESGGLLLRAHPLGGEAHHPCLAPWPVLRSVLLFFLFFFSPPSYLSRPPSRQPPL